MDILDKVVSRMVFLVIFSAMLMIAACGSSTNPVLDGETAGNELAIDGSPEITFEKTSHNFGILYPGEIVTYSFTFTNTGTVPLLITDAFSGCGCTIGEHPREPIAPGEGGKITVQFNSAGRSGYQSQAVVVITNARQPEARLQIIAEVAEN